MRERESTRIRKREREREERPESSLKERTQSREDEWRRRIKLVPLSLSTFDSFSSPTVILSLFACRSPFFDGINYKDCIRPHEYTSQILSSCDYLPLFLLLFFLSLSLCKSLFRLPLNLGKLIHYLNL